MKTGLRKKTLGAVLAILGILISGLYIYSEFTLSSSYSDLEGREVQLNLQRAKRAFDSDLSHLANEVVDWAFWDESYFFIQKSHSNFERQYLNPSSLFPMNLHLMVFLDLQGKMVWGRKLDYENQFVEPVPLEISEFLQNNPELTNFGTFAPAKKGPKGHRKRSAKNPGPKSSLHRKNTTLAHFSDGPMMMASLPLLNSWGEGPSMGTLIVGRKLDQAALAEMSRRVHLPLSLFPWKPDRKEPAFPEDSLALKKNLLERGTWVNPLSSHQLSGLTLIRDFKNRPLFLLRYEAPRDIYHLGQKVIFSMLGALALVGAGLALFIVLLLDRSVLLPLVNLNKRIREVGRSGDLSLRVAAEGEDEIGNLGREMNQMLHQLEKHRHSLRLLLDNMDQGFFSFGFSGHISFEYSQSVEKIFGQKPGGTLIADFWGMNREACAKILELVFGGKLSFDNVVDFLPKERELSGRIIDLKYRPVYGRRKGKKSPVLIRVLVVATDVTEIRLMEREKEELAEFNDCLIRILSSKEDFKDIIGQVRDLGKLQDSDQEEFGATLHTLKGILSCFGCKDLQKVCHEWEHQIHLVPRETIIRDIQARFESFLKANEKILNLKYHEESEKNMVIPLSLMEKAVSLTDGLNGSHPLKELLQELVEVRLEHRLGWLDQALEKAANLLGKKVNPIHWVSTTKLPMTGYEDLFRTLIHIVRNFADHGLETPEERKIAGKPEQGQLTLSLELCPQGYLLSFQDDGIGLDLEKIRTAAEKFQIPLSGGSGAEEVGDLIFLAGLSTKNEAEISEWSGRGIGLSSVRVEARKLQGDTKVISTRGKGTLIQVWFKTLLQN